MSQPGHPPCICGNPVRRLKGESPGRWLRRQFCSEKCRCARLNQERADEHARRTIELNAAHPPCRICNEACTRKKGEQETKFISRATCGSPKCITAYRSANQRSSFIQRDDPLGGTEAGQIEITPPDYGAGFGAHNIVPPASERLGKIGPPPMMRSYGVASY